jgi:transposase
MRQRAQLAVAKQSSSSSAPVVIGLDLGDKWSRYCVLDSAGVILEEDRVRSNAESLLERFGSLASIRIVIETGTHSPWVSRTLEGMGHSAVVANARKLRMIYESDRKNDRLDARMLARLGRVDLELLAPVQHRRAQTQADLAVIRGRDSLVAARTQLINSCRGMVKAMGGRPPKSTTSAFASKMKDAIPAELLAALNPLLLSIRALSEQIKNCDRRIHQLAAEKYPETKLLQQVQGVGPLVALTYVLTVEDPRRFPKSRAVGSYLGLRPRQSESGDSAPQLGITKAGSGHLRRLLVQSAQYMLSSLARDSRLRRWGLELASRGGKNGKRRAVIAVARKLAVLLHKLWSTGQVYEPLYGIKQAA